MKLVIKDIFARLEKEGYRCKIVSIQHLDDLKKEFEKQHSDGLLDPQLFKEYLSEFNFSPFEKLKDAAAVFIVALPDSHLQINFTWNGKVYPVIVPATYLHGKKFVERTKNLLDGVLLRAGYQVVSAYVPVKLLAVHSGLATYGRNNITYVKGMGSYHRLAAFFTDFPCAEDDWQELQMMEACNDCSACRRKCPTNAIIAERFLLQAERCLTFLNEQPGDKPFPDWIDPLWHNCLVGCLHCQRICPVNKKIPQRIEKGPEFTQEETASFLKKVLREQLAPATAKKIEQHDMTRLIEVLPRNLGVLLNREESSK